MIKQNIEYTADVQQLFLRIIVSYPELYSRISSIFNSDNFERSVRKVAEFVHQHAQEHRCMPVMDQITAACETHIEPIELDDGHINWFLDEFEKFTKRKELERAILKCADLLEKSDYDPVEKIIKDAVQISLTKDLGTDYFLNPGERLHRYFNSGGQVSTGWPQLDKLLYGGFSRGELNIFAGGSGTGKSLVMMNIALNWLSQGLHGAYITLELSEELVGLRSDAMLTNQSTKNIRRDINNTELEILMAAKKFGTYCIKSLPAQSNINHIRAFLQEYQVKTGRKVDFLMIDYLDLLMPVSTRVAPSDLFVKDKYVSEELRNLARELGVLMVTASQLNRSAVEEHEFNPSHISGGISKINTADNVFGIFTSRAMKERGKYQIQCMKSRSSTGVGHKIDLEYNNDTMRITDPGETVDSSSSSPVSAILGKIKQTSTLTPVVSTPESGPVRAEVRSTAMKQILNSFKPPAGI